MRRATAVLAGLLSMAAASPEEAARARLDADVAAGRPLVAHVVVALADNDAQGIVPVPKALGNGQSPATNLYWGARYGVRTWLKGGPGWTLHAAEGPLPDGVLERAVFRTGVTRGRQRADLWVVAEAWRGDRIRESIQVLLERAAGHRPDRLQVRGGPALSVGGAAHVVAFAGHDGLMDFALPAPPPPPAEAPARAVVVLACISSRYFGPLLRESGAHPLVLTSGLMAPEAYVLEAALLAWARGEPTRQVREAAARAYDQHQRCGLKGARRLFVSTF